MTLSIPFANSYGSLPSQLFSRLNPTSVSAPELIVFNDSLAESLGIRRFDDAAELARVFSGNAVPEGAEPLAQLYAGHQFGQWNPQLGDGRALLLGEVQTGQQRFDIQLKGSGPTPYSRNGDGRAWLGPVLREYLVSEAMHALGIPTTRALAAVKTGDPVYRESALPGAVITRVASSHIRVGTFQVLAARQDLEGLQRLFDYSVDRHYPTAQSPLDFLNAVIDAQARLVAKWMSVGFIHGVMNTDNCAISGETIDYGPCAFMDAFHPMQVFSSIDRRGRYAYGNQPDIIVGNMAQLATALVPLMPDVDAAVVSFTEAVHAMPELVHGYWRDAFAAKLGIGMPREDDVVLIQDLLSLMAREKADFTNTFRALTEGIDPEFLSQSEDFVTWKTAWQARIADEVGPEKRMQSVNPMIIPRNHQIEALIKSAVGGDFGPFHQMHQALATPFSLSDQHHYLTKPPLEEERVKATFCGT